MSIYNIEPNVFYVFKYKNVVKINEFSNISSNLIIFDNFYENPEEVRNFALQQEFIITGNFPGKRTLRGFDANKFYEKIQSYLNNIGYRIVDFFDKNIENKGNCTFTISTSKDKAKFWIHTDDIINDENKFNMAGILFLTPNPPSNSGTVFYEFDNTYQSEKDFSFDKYTFDITKWKKIDTIGNVYNRLILFNAERYHSINNLFGTDKYNGRLTQNFFFACEKTNLII